MVARKRRRSERDSSDHMRIRTLFLNQKRPSYSTEVIARMTGVDREELKQRIEDGEFDFEQVEYWLQWRDVVTIAMERWPLDVIYEALGNRADDVMPRMLRPEEFTLPVPSYILRLLEYVAASENLSVAEYVRRELHDLAESESVGNRAEIEVKIPGFREALYFPQKR